VFVETRTYSHSNCSQPSAILVVPAVHTTAFEPGVLAASYLYSPPFCNPVHLRCSADRDAEDSKLAELFRNANVPSVEVINDLPGVLANPEAAAAAAHALSLDHISTAHADSAGATEQAALTPTAAAGRPLHHRVVSTGLAMPATTRAAAAAGDDDDTSSVRTLPMPSRKRRRSEEEDEACSSPNDLVEVPAAQTAAARKRQHKAAAPAAAAAAGSSHAQHHDASSTRDQSAGTDAGNSSAANAAAAASPDLHKGILVSKLLTKSDANSKRIILPRIAVETNLPQLESAPHFHFSAKDPNGQSWPLVIKAWANGSNPKPVYVMEQIGDVLKTYKLAIGDAVALLADEQGSFYLEWNTPAAHAAAMRPTYSGIDFKSIMAAGASGSSSGAANTQQQQAQEEAKPAAADLPAAMPAIAGSSPFAVAAVKQEQQPVVSSAAAASAAPQHAAAPVKLEQPAAAALQPPAVPMAASQAPPAAPVASAAQQQQLFQQLPASSNMPLMTAVPVTQPLVPGTFIPTSPCQLLVVGHLPMPDLDLDLEGSGSLQPSLPSNLLGNLNSNGDVVMPQAAAAYIGSLEAASASEAEALLVPTGAVPQLAHAGGVLLCPRTPGCTRPAGHQGWCLGHKGYKKRRT